MAKAQDEGILIKAKEASTSQYIPILEITARQPSNRYLEFTDSELQDDKNPLVVYVKLKNGAQFEEGDFDDLFFSSSDGVQEDEELDIEEEAKEQAKYLLYNYLLLKSSGRGPDPKPVLRNILRDRCNERNKCEDICKTQPKKKKNNYCVPNCKEVFDNLDICKPPKPKRDPCRPVSDCGTQKWGKTMPPPPRHSRIYSNEKDDCDNDSCEESSDSCVVDDC